METARSHSIFPRCVWDGEPEPVFVAPSDEGLGSRDEGELSVQSDRPIRPLDLSLAALLSEQRENGWSSELQAERKHQLDYKSLSSEGFLLLFKRFRKTPVEYKILLCIPNYVKTLQDDQETWRRSLINIIFYDCWLSWEIDRCDNSATRVFVVRLLSPGKYDCREYQQLFRHWKRAEAIYWWNNLNNCSLRYFVVKQI